MKHELFSNMQKQMNPSPEVRAELSEKLARPAKKRPVPWKRYTALAACAAVMVTMCGAAVMSDQDRWNALVSRFIQDHPDAIYQGDDPYNSWFIAAPFRSDKPLHSYVTVEDAAGYAQFSAENTTTGTGGVDTGSGGDVYAVEILPAPNTGDLPGGAYVGDIPVQEGAEDYQKLMDHFNGALPDWYGGAYLDGSGRLVVQLVESEDPGDKSLELQVLDWTGSDSVMFSSCKYSLAQLKELMDRLNALPDADPVCRDVMAGWGVDEEANHIELTLTQVNDHILSVLAELDPEDDMILVRVGQRVTLTTAEGEVYHFMPGGVTVPEDDETLIADEPVYDGAHYDVENLPEELPQQKQPAFQVDSAPDENVSTPAYDPDAGFTSPKS